MFLYSCLKATDPWDSPIFTLSTARGSIGRILKLFSPVGDRVTLEELHSRECTLFPFFWSISQREVNVHGGEQETLLSRTNSHVSGPQKSGILLHDIQSHKCQYAHVAQFLSKRHGKRRDTRSSQGEPLEIATLRLCAGETNTRFEETLHALLRWNLAENSVSRSPRKLKTMRKGLESAAE